MIIRDNKHKFFGFTPQEIEVNSQRALYFGNLNQNLKIMSKEDFYEMIDMAKRFYEVDGVEEWINHENNMTRWIGHAILETEIVKDKYILPEPRIEERYFRNDLEKNWGFHCDWCNCKVSSKNDKSYFHIHEKLVKTKTITGQCCSQECAVNLWYDLIIEWILEGKLTDTFHTDKTIKA